MACALVVAISQSVIRSTAAIAVSIAAPVVRRIIVTVVEIARAADAIIVARPPTAAKVLRARQRCCCQRVQPDSRP